MCQVICLTALTALFISAIYCVLMDHSCKLRRCCVMWCELRVAMTAMRTDRVQYGRGCSMHVVPSLLLEVALRLDHRFTLNDCNWFARTCTLHLFCGICTRDFRFQSQNCIIVEVSACGCFFLLKTNVCVRTWKWNSLNYLYHTSILHAICVPQKYNMLFKLLQSNAQQYEIDCEFVVPCAWTSGAEHMDNTY